MRHRDRRSGNSRDVAVDLIPDSAGEAQHKDLDDRQAVGANLGFPERSQQIDRAIADGGGLGHHHHDQAILDKIGKDVSRREK
jgi:hypothetical protein